MTATTPAPGAAPPNWPYCGQGADPAGDTVGCRGRRVEPYPACLAHLSHIDRRIHLHGLRPGAGLDHRGSRLSAALLAELLTAVTDPATGRPDLGGVRFREAEIHGDASFDDARISGEVSFDEAEIGGKLSFHRAEIDGDASFDGTRIGGSAWFNGVRISGNARFNEARISGSARFHQARIGGDAWFEEARIADNARFHGVRIDGDAWFHGARIGGDARFNEAQIGGNASFHRARIGGDARFPQAKIAGDAWFHRARVGGDAEFVGTVFESASALGPLVCRGTLDLSEALFGRAVTIEAAAKALVCRRTHWVETAAVRLRHATVDLSDAVVEYPLSIAARSQPFALAGEQLTEPGMGDAQVRITSLRGADAAHLVLTDVDLAECRLAGTIHLDQLHLEGRCPLAAAPGRVRLRGRWPVRWTPRATLAEEQHWRADRPHGAAGWTAAPDGVEVLTPAALAPVYRQLRKAFEDGKNEPGAADFYYGEMEMRRHDPGSPRAERGLLALYWAVSGYGLRASRALAWLLFAMMTTILLMMGIGLPDTPAEPYPAGSLVVGKQDPELHAGLSDRFNGDRAEKAADVVVNSVIFRSSGQDLTTAGRYIEMVSRFAEPILLGLAALAVRGRIKR